MNQILHPPTPLPLASDNHYSDQECIDQIGGHAHHNSFVPGVPDQLRRDGALAHSGSGMVSSIPSRYSAPRPDTTYNASGVALSDSGTGSISTSPSSNASSALASYSYQSFSPTVAAAPPYSNQYPVANNNYNFGFTYNNSMPPRRMSTMTDNSSSAMLPPTRSPGLGNAVSPPMGVSARENYTTSTPGLNRHAHALSPRHSDISRYNTLPDTPRSVLSTTMPLPTYTGYGSSLFPSPGQTTDSPPFNNQETFGTIICEGNTISPQLDAKIEKGFFWSADREWTCYRRNYFAVNVSFGLNPWMPNARLYYDGGSGHGQMQIQSMAVSLAAAVDNQSGKTIELIQHTPKRDKGPQLAMKKELLAPTPPGKNHEHSGYGMTNFHQSSSVPGPQLPMQNEPDASQQYSPTSHASSSYQHGFERIQFKSATANNGKRRAQQQYYLLIVELWANIQRPDDDKPDWVKIAARSSHRVVVRGRSPSHYSNEGPHNGGTTRGAGGSGLGGSGHHSLGSSGRPSFAGYGSGLSGGGSTGMSGSLYRGNTYSVDPSPAGSHSVSSASSLSGGPVEGLNGDHHIVDGDDAKMGETPQEYAYYPAPLYESLGVKSEHSLPLPSHRVKDEYPGSGAVGSSWHNGACGRFQGIETSRGYYPDVHTHVGY